MILLSTTSVKAQSFCAQIENAKIVAQDGQFLGVISSEYDSDSIFNEYGDYGSEYSDNSIFNQYSDYGSKYSDLSPFNEYAAEPPLLIIGQKVVAVITVNKHESGAVNPYALLGCK